jgi:hypothetical protein
VKRILPDGKTGKSIVPAGKTRYEAERDGDILPGDSPTVLEASLIARRVFGIQDHEHQKMWVMSGKVMELLGYGAGAPPITTEQAKQIWKEWEGMRG